MKKILSIIIFILMATPTWSLATTYYGCAAQEITAAATFKDDAACTGTALTWANLNNGDVLDANGYTISIENDIGAADKVITLQNGAAGGGYTFDTAAVAAKTFYISIVAGGVADVLAVSGAGSGTELTILGGPITGGTGNNIDGISDTHTGGEVVVGATGSLVTINGGSVSTARGYNYGASGAGTVKIYANAIGATGNGFYNGSSNSGAIATMYEGKCQGGTGASSTGCQGGTLGSIVLDGITMIAGTGCFAIGGKVYVRPAATNYILMPYDSDYAAATINGSAVVYGPVDDGDGWDNSGTLTTEAEIKSGEKIGTATGTMSAGGSGGAWGF